MIFLLGIRDCVIKFFGPRGCVIFVWPKRLHDFFSPESLCNFFFYLRGCLIFFWLERLRDFFFGPRGWVIWPEKLRDFFGLRGCILFLVERLRDFFFV